MAGVVFNSACRKTLYPIKMDCLKPIVAKYDSNSCYYVRLNNTKEST